MTVTLSNALWRGNTMVLELLGLKKQVDGSFANSASLAVTLQDADGVAVSGVSWPLSLSYVSGSDGNYRVEIPSAAAIEDAGNLIARITGSQDGLDLDVRMPVVASDRAGSA